MSLSGRLSDIWDRKIVLRDAMLVSFIGAWAYVTLTFTGMLIARRRLQVSHTDCIAVLVNVCTADLFSLRVGYHFVPTERRSSYYSTNRSPTLDFAGHHLNYANVLGLF
jgi:hypothetical protein